MKALYIKYADHGGIDSTLNALRQEHPGIETVLSSTFNDADRLRDYIESKKPTMIILGDHPASEEAQKLYRTVIALKGIAIIQPK